MSSNWSILYCNLISAVMHNFGYVLMFGWKKIKSLISSNRSYICIFVHNNNRSPLFSNQKSTQIQNYAYIQLICPVNICQFSWSMFLGYNTCHMLQVVQIMSSIKVIHGNKYPLRQLLMNADFVLIFFNRKLKTFLFILVIIDVIGYLHTFIDRDLTQYHNSWTADVVAIFYHCHYKLCSVTLVS